MTVLKYKLKCSPEQEIQIGYRVERVLHAGEQRGDFMLWVLVDEKIKSPHSKLRVRIVGTGDVYEELHGYVSTIVTHVGYVWHIFAGVS